MNNKTYSILAIIARCGKLLGSLFCVIANFVFIGSVTYLLSLGSSSINSLFSGRIYSSAGDEMQAAAQTVLGALDFMRAGAIVLFVFALLAVLFNILARENIVGSVVDAALALVAFIMNFSLDIMSAAQNAMLSGMGASAGVSIAMNGIAAFIFILLIAILNIRSVLIPPSDSVIPERKIAPFAQKAPYSPNAFAPNANYAQPYPQQNNFGQPAAQPYPQQNNFAQPTAQPYPQQNNFAQPGAQPYPQQNNYAQPAAQPYPQQNNFAQPAAQPYPQQNNYAQPGAQPYPQQNPNFPNNGRM